MALGLQTNLWEQSKKGRLFFFLTELASGTEMKQSGAATIKERERESQVDEPFSLCSRDQVSIEKQEADILSTEETPVSNMEKI